MKIMKALYRLQCAAEEALSPWEATDKMGDLHILLRLNTDPEEKAAIAFLGDIVNKTATTIIQYRLDRTDDLTGMEDPGARERCISFWNDKITAQTELSEAAQALIAVIYELIKGN